MIIKLIQSMNLLKDKENLDGNYTSILHAVWNKSCKMAVVQTFTPHHDTPPTKERWPRYSGEARTNS